MSDKPTGLALLRVPFPPNQINKLPKPTCAPEEWKKLQKGRCAECGGWHATTSTIHLDFVGHAALTDRLLDADPQWSWEPLAFTEQGLPRFDAGGGLWIKLTVCGTTRYGYGDAQGKTGGNAIKECIGDALRNAAMRFGAALDLWHKGDLHAEEKGAAQGDEPVKVEDVEGVPKKANRTIGMQVRERIQQHLANGRELGALQEWQGPDAFGAERRTEIGSIVWNGLTTSEQNEIRRLQNEARKPAGPGAVAPGMNPARLYQTAESKVQ